MVKKSRWLCWTFRFVKADFSFEKDAATRAYINFVNEDDIFSFQQRFDGYVFLDNTGQAILGIYGELYKITN